MRRRGQRISGRHPPPLQNVPVTLLSYVVGRQRDVAEGDRVEQGDGRHGQGAWHSIFVSQHLGAAETAIVCRGHSPLNFSPNVLTAAQRPRWQLIEVERRSSGRWKADLLFMSVL